MKSVQENEANRFRFAPPLRSKGKVKVSDSGIKQQKSIVPKSMAGMNKYDWTIGV